MFSRSQGDSDCRSEFFCVLLPRTQGLQTVLNKFRVESSVDGVLATANFLERPVPAKAEVPMMQMLGGRFQMLYLWVTRRRAEHCSILICFMSGIGMRRT